MLAHAVMASPMPETHAPGFSVTQASPCSYATYLNYHGLDPRERDDSAHLTFEDGHEQEASIVKQLERAGYNMRYTGEDQLEVFVGRSKVPGHPDGLITPKAKEAMLEIKAMHDFRFDTIKGRGLSFEPLIYNQVQMYMPGLKETFGIDVDGTFIYCKNKNTCEPFDMFVEKDLSYSTPIIEAMDEIILGGWEPRPENCEICIHCRHVMYCWGAPVLNMTGGRIITDQELVEKWMKGKSYKMMGEEAYEEAREQMRKLCGSDDVIYFEATFGENILVIEAKKVPSTYRNFSSGKYVKIHGVEFLEDMYDITHSSQFRTREIIK